MDRIIFPENLREDTYFGIDSDELIHIDMINTKPKRGGHEYTKRYNGRIDWQIIYIHDGYAYFEYNGKVKRVGPYTLVVFKPHEPQVYVYKPEDGPVAHYIHFSGAAIPAIIKKFGLYDKTFYDIIPANTYLLSEMFSNLKIQTEIYRDNKHMCWSGFLDLLAKLSISVSDGEDYKAVQIYDKYQKGMEKVLKEMHDNFLSNRTVEDYAAMMNLSPSRFAHIFKQITGRAPIDYKNMLKSEYAKAMLLSSTESIEELAFQLGYSSVAQFSKNFKKRYGYTPSFYRKSNTKKTTPDES